MRYPLLAILGFACWGSAATGWAQTANAVCAPCHAEQAAKVQVSAHSAVGCETCHVKHETYPHPAGIAKPQCAECHADVAGEHAASVHGQELKRGNQAAPTCDLCHGAAHELKNTRSTVFHQAIPDTCGMCHTDISAEFKTSVHGQAVAKGIPEAPVCTNCHGEHRILRARNAGSAVNASRIRETCGQCHGNLRLSKRFGLPADRIVSFDESFHGLAAKTGSQSVANCASCHGVHNILASTDPRSTVNLKNLPTTCGKCHPGAGRRFAIGLVHQLPGAGEPTPVRWVRLTYEILIPLTIGFMLLHNGGDWLRKLHAKRFRPAAARVRDVLTSRHRQVRMNRFERIQHGLAGDLLPRAGLDRFRAQVSGPVVGANPRSLGAQFSGARRGAPHRRRNDGRLRAGPRGLAVRQSAACANTGGNSGLCAATCPRRCSTSRITWA